MTENEINQQVEKIERERMFRQLTLRNQIGDLFLKILDKDLYREILHLLQGTLNSQFGLFGYIDEDGSLTCIASEQIDSGSDITSKGIFHLPRSKWGGIWGQALAEKRLICSNAQLEWVNFSRPLIRAIVAPIIYGGNSIGVILLANKDTDYTREDESLLETLSWDIAPILSGRLEQERYREHLEEVVAKRTAELRNTIQKLEVANATAEAASQAKTDFLANMSHELRTPLNSIIGFSEVLIDDVPGPTNEDQKNLLRNILQSGNHLLNLIKNILNVTKIEKGEIKLEWSMFSLCKAVKECLETLQKPDTRQEIQIQVNIDLKNDLIQSDKTRLNQVLISLLNNALKFTPDEKNVGITLREKKEDYEIIVWDEGIGISPTDLKKLFQSFQQLENPYSKKYAGTGLGLYVVKKLVSLLKGQIWAESEVGKGSKFHLILPKGF